MDQSNPIPRLKCVVDTCSYWTNGNHCVAEIIEIRPPDAKTTKETDCGTFKLK